jgi:hypothetical protein
VCCAALLLANSARSSTIIFSNINTDYFYEDYASNPGWEIGGPRDLVQGLRFSPTQTGAVQTIEVFAFRIAGGTAVDLSLMTDSGSSPLGPGLPDSVLETLRICCFGTLTSVQVANSVLRPVLTAGTMYWLVVSPIAAGDYLAWVNNQHNSCAPNVQQPVGAPWNYDYCDYRGTLRIRGDAPTPTKVTSWGRVKALYR